MANMFRLTGILFFTIMIISCNNERSYVKNKSHVDVSDQSIDKGKLLAAQYCQSCHLLPDPSLLNSKTWETGVLPAMGPRLGIFEHHYQKYINSKGDLNIGNYYPSQPVISSDQWQDIIDYYASISPDSLSKQARKIKIDTSLALFSIDTPKVKWNNPTTCFIIADTIQHHIFTSDIQRQVLYSYNNEFQLQDSVNTGGSIVHLLQHKNANVVACNIGVLPPTNASAGSIIEIPFADNKLAHKKETIYKQLHRPVFISEADLNADGRQDFVVCEFGYLIGSLSWLESKSDGSYSRHVLRNTPGAIKSIVSDFNDDGKLDIMTLFAQGDEGIFLFINKGNGTFETETILRFPPSYGSSYFELDDFNKDGFPDILYTCGDNADYSTIFKPYHGVYIYLNDKHNHFKQSYFFPINGCYKAIAKDFDGDGDLDIATIAYFADFAHQPEEGFVYLENKGQLSFQPFSLPATKLGRWINMDVEDINGDGKPDILLANSSVGPTINYSVYNWKTGPSFMVLKNVGQANKNK